MEQAVRELLDSADDPDNAEFPPGFDQASIRTRVVSLQSILERVTGRTFTLDDNVQDASFFANLSIHAADGQSNVINTVLAIRFSNFGDLFTTWHHGLEQLSAMHIESSIEAAQSAGFRYVPPVALDESYSGRSPLFRGTTWWIRFFDYL